MDQADDSADSDDSDSDSDSDDSEQEQEDAATSARSEAEMDQADASADSDDSDSESDSDDSGSSSEDDDAAVAPEQKKVSPAAKEHTKPTRKSPRLAAAAATQAPPPEFDLDETVTGTAARGATADVIDEASKGTPLEEFDMLPATSVILQKRGISTLFPIQAETYAKVLARTDIIGRAKTGQGKTLAFVLPIVQTLLTNGGTLTAGRAPRVLCLLPTRELAKQVCT